MVMNVLGLTSILSQQSGRQIPQEGLSGMGLGARKSVVHNHWAIGVLWYYCSSMEWTKSWISDVDSTRRTLVEMGVYFLNASVRRLYLPREYGGCRLISVRESDTVSLALYSHSSSSILIYSTSSYT